MTFDQHNRANAIMEEMASVKTELGWWTDFGDYKVLPLALRHRGTLRHIPEELFNQFRHDCVQHLKDRLSALEDQFSKL